MRSSKNGKAATNGRPKYQPLPDSTFQPGDEALTFRLFDDIWRFLANNRFTRKARPGLHIDCADGHLDGQIYINPRSPESSREPEFVILHECLHYVCSSDRPEDSADKTPEFSGHLMKLIEFGRGIGFAMSEREYDSLEVRVVEDRLRGSSSRELQRDLMMVLFSWYRGSKP